MLGQCHKHHWGQSGKPQSKKQQGTGSDIKKRREMRFTQDRGTDRTVKLPLPKNHRLLGGFYRDIPCIIGKQTGSVLSLLGFP